MSSSVHDASIEDVLQDKHYREPPRNIEAEQALLGGLLHNNKSYEQVSDLLKPEFFSDAMHGDVYEAISRLIERGQIADPITLRDYFHQNEKLKEIGGATYLVNLANSVVTIINMKDYALRIRDLYLRRQLIHLGEGVVNGAHEIKLDIDAVAHIEGTEQKLYDLATLGDTDKGFVPFTSALTDAIKTAERAYRHESKIVGVTSGLKDLDKYMGGLHPSDLIILAGRPSMGKTALATIIGFNAATAKMQGHISGGGVAFFSLEMSAEQLAGRLLSQEVGIASDKIRRGELRDEDFPKFVDASQKLAEVPFFIDDTPALTVGALRARSRRLKRKHDIGLIVVDYLQLLSASGKAGENRVQEISEITRGLKTLAKELNVPVIALSQLSRSVEQRDDKRPQLSDLRESGSIEQDADVVMFVYREEYYESRREPPEGTDKYREWQEKMSKIYNVADLIIAKQRHGPIGTIKLFFDGSLARFADLEKDH